MRLLGLACLLGFITAFVVSQEDSSEYESYSPVLAHASNGYSSLPPSNSYATGGLDLPFASSPYASSPYASHPYVSPPSFPSPRRRYGTNGRGRGYRRGGSLYGRQSYYENSMYPIGPGYFGSVSGTRYASYGTAPGYGESGSSDPNDRGTDFSYSQSNLDPSGYNPDSSQYVSDFYPAPTTYVPTTSAPATTAPPATTTPYPTKTTPYLTATTPVPSATPSEPYKFPPTAYNPFASLTDDSSYQPPVRSVYDRANSSTRSPPTNKPYLSFRRGPRGPRPKTAYSVYNPRTGVLGPRYPRPGFVPGPGRRYTSYYPIINRNSNGNNMNDLHSPGSTSDADSLPRARSGSYSAATNNEQPKSDAYDYARKNPDSYFARPAVPASDGTYSPSDYGPTYDSQYNNPLLADNH